MAVSSDPHASLDSFSHPQHARMSAYHRTIGLSHVRPLPNFAKTHDALEAWRGDDNSFTPWVWLSLTHLPTPESLERIERDLADASPSGAFLLWMIDADAREYLVVQHGTCDGRWAQRCTKGGRLPYYQDILSAMTGADPFPMRTARVAAVLARKQLTNRFYGDVQKATFQIARAWQSQRPLSADARHELALLLVARTMFLQFVQSKNWLPHAQYLGALCADDHASLYRDYWRPLFFDALNLPAHERVSGVIPKEVPYLNGGLFAPAAVEERHPDLDLPNAVLRHLVVDIFASYAFVDDEHDGPYAAIAPQLLGEIFERLMAPEERQVTGAFYTPSTLASSLWRTTFDHWLSERVGTSCATRLREGGTLDTHEAAHLHTLLWDIRILDPAVGTGAFLLAALQDLEQRMLHVLRFLPDRTMTRRAMREHWVTHSLHGIDIQRNAVLLAELRLWLAVTAVSSNERSAATPLPNLAHRLRVGNALLSPTWACPRRRQRASQKLTDDLADALTQFPRVRGEQRRALLAHIEGLEQRLVVDAITQRVRELHDARHAQTSLLEGARTPTASDEERALRAALDDPGTWQATGGIDPKLHYADVMKRGGFDIIIGNPPWGQIALLDKNIQGALRQRYQVLQSSGGRQASPDMSVAFFEAFFPLLQTHGHLGFLFPAKTLRAGWGGAWRKWVERETHVVRLQEFATDSNHGFHASVYPCFAVLANKTPNSETTRHPLLHLHTRSPHARSSQKSPFLTRSKPRYGVKTGYNTAFLVPKNSTLPWTFPIVRGKDLRAGQYTIHEHMIFPHDPKSGEVLSELPPALLDHLSSYRPQLEKRSDLRPNMPWWTLFRVREDMLGWRVAWRDVATSLQAVVLPQVIDGGPINLNSTYAISCADREEAERRCAWLNRAETTQMLLPYAQRARNGYYRFDARLVGMLSCPPPP